MNKSEKKDNSWSVGVVMMALFGIIGAAINGIGGFLAGALLGFSVTALVYAAQQSFPNK